MAGAFRMALSNADVTITDGGGEVVHKGVTASVRDGHAKARMYGRDIDTMPVVELIRHTRNDYEIVGPEGKRWRVIKDCGCTGSR